jgi:hypothetical protein
VVQVGRGGLGDGDGGGVQGDACAWQALAVPCRAANTSSACMRLCTSVRRRHDESRENTNDEYSDCIRAGP